MTDSDINGPTRLDNSSFTIMVTGPLTAPSGSLGFMPIGCSSYLINLQASGGVPPYLWSSNDLPPFLALSPQGELTLSSPVNGPPRYTIHVTVQDRSYPPSQANAVGP